MKKNNSITSVEDLLGSIETVIVNANSNIIFRGQPCNDPLLPKVARNNPKRNTTALEKEMVKEFRRRLARERDVESMDDWDVLIHAQHYGLATRLLDWTTNPLFALWFACSDYSSPSDGFIYSLIANDSALLDPMMEKDPYKIKKTYIVKPNVNNIRIRTQSGWFTAHGFSKEAGQVEDLRSETFIGGDVFM
jgi:hypothetical protein